MTNFNAIKIIAVVISTISISACGYANLDATKANACNAWRNAGYECIGYEGYQWGRWVGGPYGGADVWYTMRRSDTPGIVYSGYASRWGDEYHLYGPNVINAVIPAR